MEIKDPKMWAAFEKYCEWRSLPRFYHDLSDDNLQEKGLSPDLVELCRIRFKKDFAEKFAVPVSTLADWDKHPDLANKIKKNWKAWCKSLTPGVMGKFHEKLMAEADAGRMKIWLQSIEEEGKEEPTVNVNLGLENIIKSMKEDGDLKEGDKEDGK